MPFYCKTDAGEIQLTSFAFSFKEPAITTSPSCFLNAFDVNFYLSMPVLI